MLAIHPIIPKANILTTKTENVNAIQITYGTRKENRYKIKF